MDRSEFSELLDSAHRDLRRARRGTKDSSRNGRSIRPPSRNNEIGAMYRRPVSTSVDASGTNNDSISSISAHSHGRGHPIDHCSSQPFDRRGSRGRGANRKNSIGDASALNPPHIHTASSSTDEQSRGRTLPHIGYNMLTKALAVNDDDLIGHITHPSFQLDTFLNDERLKIKFDWLEMLTTIFERILHCKCQERQMAQILAKLPGSLYFEALLDEIRKPDPKTKQYRVELMLKTLKILDQLLTVNPKAESAITSFTDRISLLLPRLPKDTVEIVKSIEERNTLVKERAEQILNQKQLQSSNEGKTKSAEIDDRTPPDDFRLLDIVPSMQEILSDEPAFLRKNLVDQGACYKDANHYLDIHFRLLREDFLKPLRDGVQTYLSKSSEKNSDVRIYENVLSLGPKLDPKIGMVFLLRLDKTKLGKIQWKNSRRLIFGSLVALTSDYFQKCTIMTVEDRSGLEKDLTLIVRPYIPLGDMHIDANMIKFDELLNASSFTMVETTSYFEAYRHILRALQKISYDEFPLAPYILKLSHDVAPPDYIRQGTTFDFTPLLVTHDSAVSSMTKTISAKSRKPTNVITGVVFSLSYKDQHRVSESDKRVPVLDRSMWPTAEKLSLNPKQYEALVLALTKKIALIQGPPGTGKTFLGVKIAELLLHNRSVWSPTDHKNSPVLMVCQTNHALDQFLEHIVCRLKINDGVIRVGGRCKNETILPFSLAKLRQRYREEKMIPSHIHAQKRDIMGKKNASSCLILANEKTVEMTYQYFTTLDQLQSKNIINPIDYQSLILGVGHYQKKELVLEEWLGLSKAPIRTLPIDDQMALIDLADQEGHPYDQNTSSTDEEEEEEERRREDIDDLDDYQGFSKPPRRVVSKPVKDNNEASEEEDPDGWKISGSKKLDAKIIRDLLHSPTTYTDEQVAKRNGSLWNLTIPERRNLYQYWLMKYRNACHGSVDTARAQYNQAVEEHRQYMLREDYYILSKAVIIAMTTTGAAKYFDVLQQLGCKIVIVEEAAEIFEAHIVTSLSPKCEHLILIGDHVQLRPNPSVYRLAAHYKIDVSLFERLVKNDFPNVRLNIQHRMHPTISKLMTHFYQDLKDHPTVETARPPITGVRGNLFFVTHRSREEKVNDGNSKQNKFEAEYVIALAHYLIKQGYQTSHITILVMYLGQRALISRLIKQSVFSKALQGIRVQVTDSYQGEENEIILLSLVRSENPENSIGFLKIHNRICVALSRARRAMYIVGNLDFLMKNEEMWKNIGNTLKECQAIGPGLSLCCSQHPGDQPLIAKTAADFKKRPEGGCDKMCGARLPCGHSCPKLCHNYSHDDVPCTKTCGEIIPSCQHQCKKACHYKKPNEHGLCSELVEKEVYPCRHRVRLPCHREPTSDQCTELVQVRLPCNHFAQVTCAMRNSHNLNRTICREPCRTILSCGHPCRGTCSDCRVGRLHLPCQETCVRKMLCSHSVQTTCAEIYATCGAECETRCPHSMCKLKCGEPCTRCREPCANECPHEKCSLPCSEPCDRNRCNYPCQKTITKCKHPCIGLCGEPCPSLCRTCNKLIVQETFFGKEDHPQARFVLLPDCGHIFEMTGMDKKMDEFYQKLLLSRIAISFPRCPRASCDKPILHCLRYTSIINQIQLWVQQIQSEHQNGLKPEEIFDQRHAVSMMITKLSDDVRICIPKIDSIFRHLEKSSNSGTIDELNLLKNIQEFLAYIRGISPSMEHLNSSDEASTNIREVIQDLLTYIFQQITKHHIRNYTYQQLFDIQNELRRLRSLVNYSVLASVSDIKRNVNFKNEFDRMKFLVEKLEPFTEKDQRQFDEAMEGYVCHQPHFAAYLALEQKISIVETVQMDIGHWFVCQHGFVYSADQKTGYIENTRCGICAQKKRSIARGNSSHRSKYTYASN